MKMGVNPVMVTGDNWRTALAVAKEVVILFLFLSYIWFFLLLSFGEEF